MKTQKIIGYVRVSTEEQAASGLSLAAQRAKIQSMAALHDWPEPIMIEDSGASAKSLSRPGMKHLLDLIDSGDAGIIIVAKLDRLTRSVRDLADLLDLLQSKNVALVSVAESLDTSTAAGRMVIGILGVIAQWEREAIGERTRDALAARRASGRRVGTVPWGFRLATDEACTAASGLLESDMEENAITTLTRDSHAQGMTLNQIARFLGDMGYSTRAGGAWTRQSVHRILKRTQNMT